VEGGEPNSVSRGRLLSMEDLLASVDAALGVIFSIVGWERKLVVAWFVRRHPPNSAGHWETAVACARPWRIVGGGCAPRTRRMAQAMASVERGSE
jgi:hypothetical protein